MLTHRLQSPDSRLRVFRHVSVCMQICMCVCVLFYHVSECACVHLGRAPVFSCFTVEASLQDSPSHTWVGLLCGVLSQQKHPDIERSILFAGSR